MLQVSLLRGGNPAPWTGQAWVVVAAVVVIMMVNKDS